MKQKSNNQILAEIAEEILKGDIVIYSGKSEKLLNSFSKYCADHPEQRFWQSLRNWSGSPFILKAKGLDNDFKFTGIEDTYYEK